MKQSVRRKAWLVLAALVISMSLSACTGFMKEVTMATSVTENGASVPVVDGFLNSRSINQKLLSEFQPLAERMKVITDESEGRLRVEYGMTELTNGLFGGQRSVTMYLSDDSDELLELRSVTISGFDTVKAAESEDTAWLNSAKIAESALTMQRCGIEFDHATLGDSSTEKNAVETFIKLYEYCLGRETDISEVVVFQDDPVTQKALLLEFVDCYSDFNYQYDDHAYLYRMTQLIAKTMKAIERDVYGRQSENVTGEELAAILRTIHSAMQVPEWEDYDHTWSELGQVNTNEIIASMDMTNKTFTRRDAAELLGRLTKTGPRFSMKYADTNLQRVEDASESIWVRRAVTHGFMNYYGDSTMFAPWESLTLVNAIETAQYYLSTRFNDWSYMTNYKWDGYFTNGDVMIAAACTAEYFNDRADGDRNFEVKTVLNDRDYDWFFSQKNTGAYSDVNCMPSIATMACHWYNQNSKATVKKMRATSGYDDGWTAYYLRNGLSAYNVPYTVVDATLENITDALDSGSIVLAQYSDRPLGVSGHCYVIYGYRRFKNSLTFIVNDSDSLTGRAQIFGRAMGNGDEIEATFSMWTISRFVDDVTVVSPRG